ncbi:hypothetical protein BGZ58_008096 [Dissophora ornata]|nr:hypothetical protein BGZ58_008096 [Dissophora ornata]
MRGYPTGHCVSSSDPPPVTAWDEHDPEDLLLQARRQSMGTNTAFNLETLKMFINSPLFSNFLKILTVMLAVSLFVIALDAIVILHKDLELQGEIDTLLSNANASLYITVILSILMIVYSCFTIFLEMRRPPEGLDASNSKPLFVIFSEIVASIIWAQVLSVTIYIYSWTFGCTEAGERQLNLNFQFIRAVSR